MRIKQIELNGFKSFMERTVLELPPGVTAIVGPNGCGKSNVVDAIRWVLGEQSPKHLRGSAMEDVIFAGNGDFGPLGMAEVSLLLERSEEDLLKAETAPAEEGSDGLPPGLAKASEILVSRRYFRSGESEYFINQAPCRLKDITELFLGTGVGTKAYAIIEQGRVEQLVNAKPDEMRHFIEEAAGTTRFRARKVAAERKMERTRDNLLRVQDVIRELERQMASLQRQAKRAEEYHRLKDELRRLDLRVLATRHRTWSSDVLALDATLTTLHDDERELVARIQRLQDSTDAARRQRQQIDAQLRQVEEELTAQRLRATEMQARAAGAATRCADIERRAAMAEAETGRLRDRLAELEAQRSAARADVTRLAAEAHAAEAELRATEERLKALDRIGAPLEQGVEAAKDRLVDALGEEVRLRNLSEALERRRDELKGQRARLDDEQRALGVRLETNARERELARAELQRLADELARIDGARTRLVAERNAAQEAERAAAASLETARGVATQLRSRAESLRELQTRSEGCTRGVATLLARDSAAKLLADVLRVPVGLERAVAAALGARLQQVVVPSTAEAVEAIRWLRESEGGTATALPSDPERRATVIVPPGRRLVDELQVDGQHWGLAEALLGSVLLADDLDSAMRLWRDAAHAVTVVTMAGEAIDPLGAVTGGSEASLEETLLARARELRELEGTLRDAEARAAGEASVLEERRRDVERIVGELAALDDRHQGARVAEVAASKDRERLDEERTRISAELEVGALEVGGLAGADGEMSGELAVLAERLATASEQVRDVRATLAARQQEVARWREDLTQAERAHTEQAVRSTQATERSHASETTWRTADAAWTDVSQRLEAAVAAREEAAAGIAATTAERDQATAVQADAEARVEALQGDRERLASEVARAEANLSAEDHEERVARDRVEEIRTRRGDVDRQATERRFALQGILDRLLERYGVGVEAFDDVPSDTIVDEEEATRAEEIRVRIARLGDVNPAAMAEYDEVKQRYEFLTQQRSDLERSLEDLRQTIAKLTRTSRQRFEETFAAANAKLAEVFPKVFAGGMARLELVPSEEGGEPGVEIVVQLAGKKLQSLSLLSGGEKALTATALVFSLFLIRPTPFCLLDEVDAPLDEANIGRFNQIVQDMAERSQFVLITHNRRTMEAAETLYGITMEKPGVSKVVSVRLREAA
ncbi:MAG TPA: chromosome segregation protein SMC [Candidatus Eisenbacteria bacterium]|nr:chromosome segregation protein SMC [Candidatus Eisenbacteria bacterium]